MTDFPVMEHFRQRVIVRSRDDRQRPLLVPADQWGAIWGTMLYMYPGSGTAALKEKWERGRVWVNGVELRRID